MTTGEARPRRRAARIAGALRSRDRRTTPDGSAAPASARHLARGLFAGVVAAQVGYSSIPEGHRVGATRGIVGLLLAASTAEAVAARGRRGAALVATAGGVGFATELVGVATGRPFGHYGYSALLGPRVRGVPVAAAAAWAMMARPSWVTGGWAVRGVAGPRRRRILHVAAASAALTAWDVFLDPRMVREGYWTWPGGGRYADVPASNFAGWFATSAVVFGTWSLLGAEEPDRRDDGALGLYGWTWAGETFANLALWRQPLVAAAGTTAMGLVLAPAARGRRDAGAAAPPRTRRTVLAGAGRRRLRHATGAVSW